MTTAETPVIDAEVLPEPATEARRQVARLIDEYPWTVPSNVGRHARRLLREFRRLEHAARAWRRPGDVLARVLEVRLNAFRTHWSRPPAAHELAAFREDLVWLVKHDIPRIRRLLSGLTTGRRVQHEVDDRQAGIPRPAKKTPQKTATSGS